jgi:hypothetical protein
MHKAIDAGLNLDKGTEILDSLDLALDDISHMVLFCGKFVGFF